MPFAYLTPDERRDLQRTVLDLAGYDTATRRALVNALPPQFRALLSEVGAPALQLQGDLIRLNTTERLRDGTVPFALWLQEFLSLFGSLDGSEQVHRYLDKVTRTATGAPDVAPVTQEEEQEAIVHQDDMVPFSYMQRGVAAAAAVAKIGVPRFDAGKAKKVNGEAVIFLGTGWLMATRLLVTNHHVFNARMKGENPASKEDFALQAKNASVIFGYDAPELAGSPVPIASVVAADAALDYALVRLGATDRAPLTTYPDPPVAVPGHSAAAVNIIQHPEGKPKKFAIRNNLIASITDTDLRYFTDTLGGSSGSPVLDDEWRVIALHRGSTFAPNVKFQGKEAAYLNVGTRMSAIMSHLRSHFAGQIAELNV